MFNEYVKDIDEGIFIDFVDDTFVFIVKDHWSKEEIGFLKNKKGLISYSVVEGLNIFTVSIEEGLETSDTILTDFNKDDISKLSLLKFKLLIFDDKNEMIIERTKECDQEISNSIKEVILSTDNSYSDEEISKRLNKIYQMYEPFEIEEKAKILIKF